jgi:hypothetical protein
MQLKDFARRQERLLAGLELGLLFSTWFATIWYAWRWSGASNWTAAGFVLLVSTLNASLWIRRPGWKNSGFRFDNFWAALSRLVVPIGLMLLALITMGAVKGVDLGPASMRKLAEELGDGILQEAFFVGYLFHRWLSVTRSPRIAMLANALTFSLVHLPNIPLVLLTACGGLFMGSVFLRWRNVFAVGLIHGMCAATFVPALRSAGVEIKTIIGPGELATLAEKIAREWQPTDRIGVGPNDVYQAQFGRKFPAPIERIGHKRNDHETNRRAIEQFLAAEGRVFMAISWADLVRYVESPRRDKLTFLGERYVWKRQFTMDGDWYNRLFFGGGDVPFLGAYRERVVVLSNR